MYKISIIIPIYNAENYLERAIKSVINQTLGFENIELILIDDNSTDNSKSIIQKYEKQYDNVLSIFIEKNTGLPSILRNLGIKMSSSNYLMFMDSDDEYHDDLCKKLYDTILKENADLASCNYYDCDSISVRKADFDYTIGNPIIEQDKIIFTDDKLILFDNIVVWNKLFKKDIIINNNIKFYEIMAEDFVFCIEYLINTKKRIYLPNYYGYHKFLQNDSLITQINTSSIKEKLEIFNYIHDLIISKIDKKDEELFINTLFNGTIKWIIEEISNLSSYDESIECIKLLYTFEMKISFDYALSNFIINFINRLILKKQFKLTSFILKIANYSKQSNFIKKSYRLFSNRNTKS